MKVKIKKSGKLVIKVDDADEIYTLYRMSKSDVRIPRLLGDINSEHYKIAQKILYKLFKKLDS